MKKFGYVVLSLALAIVCLCSLVACGGKAGTYKLDSMKISILGVSTEVKAGEEYEGEKLSADALKLELKDDGTFSFIVAEEFEFGFDSISGSWKENEEDSNKIELMVENITVYTLTYESGKLNMTIDLKLLGKYEINFKK